MEEEEEEVSVEADNLSKPDFLGRSCLTSLSCRTATLDFFFDLTESKVAVFLCSILTSDGVPFCFGKNSFP